MDNASEKKFTPKKRAYFYRNHHGKVVVLDEEVAAEQHNQHPKYYGSSDDLMKSGWDYNEALVAHLEKNVSTPTPPVDKRKISNYSKPQPGQVNEGDVLAYILKNKEQIKELLK